MYTLTEDCDTIEAQTMSHPNRILFTAQYEIAFRTTPAVWEFRKDADDPNEAIFGGRANFKLERRTFDPWKVREEFFSIRSPNHLWSFLERTGLFATALDAFTDLDEWKTLFRALMKSNPVRWSQLKGDFAERKLTLVLQTRLPSFEVQWGKSVHRIALTATSTLAAIVTSIEIDHLRGVEYAFCQREDCGKPYPSRSNKKFCDYDCAHLYTVRRLRAKQRRNRKHEKWVRVLTART
jgi:hypothetical protein